MALTPRYLVSACLCSHTCRFDGAILSFPRFERYVDSGLFITVCPELLAGLGVPRPPCEILNGRVFTSEGEDVTAVFRRGATLTLDIALQHGLRAAIFKDRSPSCGVSTIYDGSFNNRLISGQGITTSMLRQNGITVFSEANAPPML